MLFSYVLQHKSMNNNSKPKPYCKRKLEDESNLFGDCLGKQSKWRHMKVSYGHHKIFLDCQNPICQKYNCNNCQIQP